MFKLIKKQLPAIMAFVAIAMIPLFTNAAVSSWQQGASMVPRNTTDFSSDSFKQSVKNLAGTGANYVTLIVPYYQSNRYSADLQRGWNTPTDESLVSGISYIHSLGMKVNLKIHIELFSGEWRALIDPNGSERTAWFANYGNILNHYARLAQQNGVEQYTLGTELIRMSSEDHNPGNTQAWKNMISGVKSLYSGQLTYSANWGEDFTNKETTRINFWNDLDYLGISAYYYLNRDWNNNSVESFKSSWANWDSTHISPFQQMWNKPLLFSEVGYRSYTGAHTQPWEWSAGGSYDGQEQANAYEALFQYWNGVGYMQGVSFWEWETNPNAGRAGNIGYTPQNKPAQQVMTNWFGSNTPNPTPTPPPTGTPSFTSTGSLTPTSPVVNQTVTLNVSIKDVGAPVSNSIVDIEIYNSSNQRVFQKFFESQNFAQNETKNYSTQFTPATIGSYYMTIGVFNNSWSTNFHWNTTANFNVSSQSNTPPPSPTPTPAPSPSCNTIGTNAFAACYYDNIDLTNIKINRSDTSINYDWGNGSPDSSISPDTFSAQWQGNFSFDAATYNFTVTADDGLRLYIDDVLVLDKWIDQPPTTYNFSRALTAGSHLVKVQYYENTGGAVAKVSWIKQQTQTPPPSPTPTPTPSPQPPPPPSSDAVIEIWWPTNGTYISGTQPFQAIVQNMSLSNYTMYWQVDGGTLNQMQNDSSNGAPHKRAWVDVSGWFWNNNGPYRVTFVAKNLNGQIIAQKEVFIHIAR